MFLDENCVHDARERMATLKEKREKIPSKEEFLKNLQEHLVERWRYSELSRKNPSFDYKKAIQIFVAMETPPTPEGGNLTISEDMARDQLERLKSQYPTTPLPNENPLSFGSENNIPSFEEFSEWYQKERHLHISQQFMPEKEYKAEKERVEAHGKFMAEGMQYLEGDITFFEKNVERKAKTIDEYISLKKESIIANNLASADKDMVDIILIAQGRLPNPSPQTLQTLYRFLKNEESAEAFRTEWEKKISDGKMSEEHKKELWIGLRNGKGKMDLFTLAMLEIAKDAEKKLQSENGDTTKLDKAKANAEAGDAKSPQRIEELLFDAHRAEGYKRVGMLGNLWGFLGYEVGTLWVGAVVLFNTMAAWQQGKGFGDFVQNVAANPYIVGGVAGGYALQKVADRTFAKGTPAMKYFQEQDLTDWKYQFFGNANEYALLELVDWTNAEGKIKEMGDRKKEWNKELQQDQKEGKRKGEKKKETNELSVDDFFDEGQLISGLFKKEDEAQAKTLLGELKREEEQASFKYKPAKARKHFWKTLINRSELRQNLSAIHSIAEIYKTTAPAKFHTLPK